MRRREFIALVGGAASWPVAAQAQRPDRMRLIGVLMGFAEHDPIGESLITSFRGGLTNLGWVEGSNLRIELRWGGADPDQVAKLAKELVDLRPAVIFSEPTLAASALARETRTIPIVFALVSDPIGNGFAASLAHPGGNMTGFASLDPALGGKWVGLLREIAPHVIDVALLFNPETAMPFQKFMPSFQAATSSIGVQVREAPAHETADIEKVIAAQARTPGGGLVVMPDVFNARNRDVIIALAAKYGVPAIYFNGEHFAKSGGLIGYSDDNAEASRLAAGYVDRILKGEKPADLPVQAPTKYQLVINLKTAKALGLTVPPALLATADEVIE
jgi:putative tryptophan/tyrosine transport system substrate-binding protein